MNFLPPTSVFFMSFCSFFLSVPSSHSTAPSQKKIKIALGLPFISFLFFVMAVTQTTFSQVIMILFLPLLPSVGHLLLKPKPLVITLSSSLAWLKLNGALNTHHYTAFQTLFLNEESATFVHVVRICLRTMALYLIVTQVQDFRYFSKLLLWTTSLHSKI